jgi:RecB family exonuclease
LAESAATRATDGCLARFPARVRALEALRVAARLREWFKVDEARPDFEVVGTEVATEAEAGTLPLKLRIDRIDATEDGLLVLDYKTGPCDVRDWAPGALAEPQLPLYATVTEGVSGAAYARVNAQQSRLLGISADAERYRGAALRMGSASDLTEGDPAAPADGSDTDRPDWNGLLAAWRVRLRDLAEAFIAGRAAVQPLARSSCDFCHLHALCRIDLRDDTR